MMVFNSKGSIWWLEDVEEAQDIPNTAQTGMWGMKVGIALKYRQRKDPLTTSFKDYMFL